MNNRSGNEVKPVTDLPDFSLYDQLAHYLFVVNPALSVVFCNKSLRKEFPETNINRLPALIKDEEGHALILSCILRAQNGTPNRCGLWFYLPASGIQSIDFKFNQVEIDGDKYVIVEGCIVTSHRQIEENLREECFRYRNILDHTVDIYFMFDLQGYIVDTNNQAVLELGYSRDELFSMKIDQLDTSLSHTYSDFTAEIDTFESILQSKKGQVIPYEVKIRKITYVKIPYLIAFYRNISERKDYEQKLLEAKQQSDEANRSKSRFLANMSHELRTPLNGILGLNELLQESGLSESQDMLLRMIRSSAENLFELIQNLLDFSQIDAGKITIKEKSFNLQELVIQTCTLLEKRSREKGVELSYSFDCECANLYGDRVRIGQIVMNLLTNAVKYTDRGFVSIKVSKESGKLFIAVSDSGIGIPEDKRDEIFDRFQRIEDNYTSEKKGAGLGLSIVKEIVDIMGGSISLESKPGEGSTFTAVLPWLEPPDGSDASLSGDAVVISLEGVSVLFAEDDPINSLFVSSVLEKKGAKVTQVQDGLSVLEKLGERYDVILLDVSMPGMNGMDVARKIREHSVNSSVPLIGITAHAYVNDIKKCIEAGMNEVLTKPVSSKELCERIFKSLSVTTQ